MRHSPSTAALVVALVAGCSDGTAPPATTPDLSAAIDAPVTPVDAAPDTRVEPLPDLGLADLITQDAGPATMVISHANWVNFCLNFTACGYFAGASGGKRGMSYCLGLEPKLGNLPFLPLDGLLCVQAAGSDCNKIAQCFNNNDPNFTCQNSGERSCSGEVSHLCISAGDVKIQQSIDCTKLGLHCVTSTNPSNTRCGLGQCTGTEQLCVAGFRGQCAGGNLVPNEDCRAYVQESCAVTDGGVAQCTGLGTACTEDRCSGTKAVRCMPNGKEATYDCTGRDPGFTCFVTTGVKTAYCAFAQACDTTHIDTCNGTVLSYCNAGKVVTVDCAQKGFTKCVPQIVPDGGFLQSSGGYCQK